MHLCGMVLENIYGFIIAKNEIMDPLYLASFTIIPFSWILCKDECVISYWMKKMENPNYLLGSEPEDTKDIADLFPNKIVYSIFYNANHLLRIGSLVVVNNRTIHLSSFILYPALLFYSCYNYDIAYKLNFRQKIYPYFQIILSVYLFLIFHRSISTFYY